MVPGMKTMSACVIKVYVHPTDACQGVIKNCLFKLIGVSLSSVEDYRSIAGAQEEEGKRKITGLIKALRLRKTA